MMKLFKLLLILNCTGLLFRATEGITAQTFTSGANDIFADQTLISDCTAGDYSTANRDCSGTDGNAASVCRRSR